MTRKPPRSQRVARPAAATGGSPPAGLGPLCTDSHDLHGLARAAWEADPTLGLWVGLMALREAFRLQALGANLWSGVLEFCESFEGTMTGDAALPASRATRYFGGEPTRLLKRAAAERSLPDLLGCIDAAVEDLGMAEVPFTGPEEIPVELHWGVCRACAPSESSPRVPRWRTQVLEGAPHGDLYELEVSIYHRVLDWPARAVALSFTEETWAQLSTSGGGWDHQGASGVEHIHIDGGQVVVRHHDGREERVVLPG